jgi:hypothetical protein
MDSQHLPAEEMHPRSKLVLWYGNWVCTPRGHKEVYTINNSKIKIPVNMQYHPKYQGKFNISVSNNYFILKIPV